MTFFFFSLGLFLCIYAVLSSILFGLCIYDLFPDFVHNRDIVKLLAHPICQLVQVSILIALALLWVYFPHRIGEIPLFVILFLLILQSILTKMVYFGIKSRNIRILLFITSFLAPISLSYIYVYAIVGTNPEGFFHPLAILIDCFVIVSILLISGSFMRLVDFRKEEDRATRYIKTLIHESFIVFMFFLAITPTLLLRFTPYMLLNPWLDAFCTALVVSLCIHFYIIHRKDSPLATFISAISLCLSILISFLLMHLPYLFYPDTLIHVSYGTSVILFAMAVVLLMSAIGYYRGMFGIQSKGRVY